LTEIHLRKKFVQKWEPVEEAALEVKEQFIEHKIKKKERLLNLKNLNMKIEISFLILLVVLRNSTKLSNSQTACTTLVQKNAFSKKCK
jgi:hypothetical protein